jgi:ATP-dependent Clp protease ATP-binding subunit ClpC
VFERFNAEGRDAIIQAQEHARELNHGYIGTEHLLLALVVKPETGAAEVLAGYGLDERLVRERVEDVVGIGSGPPPGHIPFTPRMKKVLEFSHREAMRLGHDHIGGEHLLLGLVREGGGVGARVIEESGAKLDGIRVSVVRRLGGRSDSPFVPRGFLMPASDEVERPDGPAHPGSAPSTHTCRLGEWGVDMLELMADTSPYASVGRTAETAAIIRILCRLATPNVLLVGEAGVGKAGLVGAVALALSGDSEPEPVRGKRIVRGQFPLAAIGSRSAFGDWLRIGLTELALHDDVILFLDNPPMRPELWAGVLPHLALQRRSVIVSVPPVVREAWTAASAPGTDRFHEVVIAEPAVDQATEMLRAARAGYEKHHRVRISDEALAAAVRLTDRRIIDRRLPAKALDLIDDVAAATWAGPGWRGRRHQAHLRKFEEDGFQIVDEAMVSAYFDERYGPEVAVGE